MYGGKVMENAARLFAEFVKIVAQLRNPKGGCPWDLEQTHTSLKPYLIEEAYEVVEAIEQHPDKLAEELGDLLLQVVLHAQLASEEGRFDISKVLEVVSQKLIRRHPHVFGDLKVTGAAQVLKNWEQIKKDELPAEQSILAGVPRGMPALQRAQRLGEKAARVGFDWHDAQGVRSKVFEELKEFLEAAAKEPTLGKDDGKLKEEFGDLLFALVQWARKSGLDAEQLLHHANDKFCTRFKYMEKNAGRLLKELNSDELEALWSQAKTCGS